MLGGGGFLVRWDNLCHYGLNSGALDLFVVKFIYAVCFMYVRAKTYDNLWSNSSALDLFV